MEENQEQTQTVQNPVEDPVVAPQAPDTPSCEGQPSCHKSSCRCGLISTILLAVAVVVLYVLHFAGIGSPKGKYNPNATVAVANEDGLKIAYIDTDTLMAKYQYAIDLQKEIEQFQAAKQNSLKSQMNAFQNDYQTYLQTGDKLTLTQQKAKEEELQKRAEKLQGLEGEYAMQVQEKLMKESEKMTNAVYAFIREYNAANQQFDLILAKSFNQSPVLYGNPGMDITNEILEGLNDEYSSIKNKDAKED